MIPLSQYSKTIDVTRRITERDRWIARLLHEHLTLTTDHINAIAFGHLDTAQHRLVILQRIDLVDRFRPFRSVGSAPFHYVLGSVGAAIVAAEQGVDIKKLGYRRDRLALLAHNPQLAHMTGVSSFFCDLISAGRLDGEVQLVDWWSQRRCAEEWGTIVRPDGYGVWRCGDTTLEFFLEYDRGTETIQRVVNKLDLYEELASRTGVKAVVLFWFPTEARERTFRRMVGTQRVRVATSNAAQGRPSQAVWLHAKKGILMCPVLSGVVLLDPHAVCSKCSFSYSFGVR